jgi:hypothetical protein
MKLIATATAAALLVLSSTVLPQSLAELAEKEKLRRQKLKEEKAVAAKEYDLYHLSRVRQGWSAEPSPSGTPQAAPDLKTAQKLQEQGDPENRSPQPPASVVLASLIGEAMPEATKDVEFQRSRGGELPLNPGSKTIGATDSSLQLFSRRPQSDRFFDGAVYVDWFRSVYDDGLSTAQLSTRLKLDAGKRPGYGWRWFMDARHRYAGGSSTKNKLLVYDARFIYDKADSRFALSLGQMNLYESAGLGQLAGGVVGVKLNPAWTIGGYGGLEPDIYAASYDLAYTKYGVFSQYHGPGARSAAVSYNRIQYDGATEREFLYGSGLIPVSDVAVVYGSAEYELGDGILTEDRLSHLFLNARYSFSRSADVTSYYSSGRGLDYHRFLLEQSQTPDRNSAELERFYYTESYGARFSLELHEGMRVFVAQRESVQKDESIRNHTTQLGASAWDLGGTGIGLYGSYNFNRGDQAESDSYRISVSRDFGPLAWTGYYSSTFNGVRFDALTGRPLIVHLADHRTISNDFFFTVNEALAFSLEHDLTRNGEEDESTLFFRFMFRF